MGTETLRIVRDGADPLAHEPAVGWAVEQLREALAMRRASAARLEWLDADGESSTGTAEPSLLVAGRGSAAATEVLRGAGVQIPGTPEALGLVPGRLADRPVLLACGTDARGLAYAVRELADRVVHAEDPLTAMSAGAPLVEQPATVVRGVARLFTSEISDKPWFYDMGFWRRYLSELMNHRFNRFSLTLGLGYNFPHRVRDVYLHFAYPFLVSVPGYSVRVPQLSDEEREKNLEMLRFVSEETVACGLQFQLGLWTHGYEWVEGSIANYTTEGLTPANHAAYCRDALHALLAECPAIQGITFRTHGESGIAERSWSFWRTVFDGIVRSGRSVEIDLHAKGLDRETLDIALATGQPVNVSAKYGAEHMGLPYHQAGIRELERPREPHVTASSDEHAGFMGVSEGSRPFTRYGYADFLREDRRYGVSYRVWPGTQRLLLWGDPAMAAGYGRHSSIAGSRGVEWCEPLSFKGREGSGTPGPRDGYADPSLHLAGGDWEKYRYTYRLLGRLSYDQDASPETWQRYLRGEFGQAAGDAESALANASRILPLVTTAHHPSASNNYYWPEISSNLPIVWPGEQARPAYYWDMPDPWRFGTVSALDPELFSSAYEFVGEALEGRRSVRYSPLDVAEWLDGFAQAADRHLAAMRSGTADDADPRVRRWAVDIAIQACLGRFYAEKLRTAVRYEEYVATGRMQPLRTALRSYRAARAAWADGARHASGVYLDDLTFGQEPHLRGHWSDRLAEVDADIAAMEAALSDLERSSAGADDASLSVIEERDVWESPEARVSHTPPAPFCRGDTITIARELDMPSHGTTVTARLRYRHLNQAERYAVVDMAHRGEYHVATIPGSYSDSPYPLQYFFELRDLRNNASQYPGLNADLSNQPYFVLRHAGRGRCDPDLQRTSGASG
jgi:hypothetical protein